MMTDTTYARRPRACILDYLIGYIIYSIKSILAGYNRVLLCKQATH